MKVIVFGGRGFIGRNVVGRLAKERRYEVVVADFGEAEAKAREGCDIAIFAHGSRANDLEAAIAVHATLTEQLLWAARPGRAVYLSSGECYGPGEVPFRETQPLLGSTPYALAKQEGERRVQAYAQQTGSVAVVLRPAVVYGVGQTGTMLLPAVLSGLLAGDRVALTLGTQTRDFVEVSDVAELITRCLDAEVGSDCFNVGTGIETKVRDAAAAAAACLSARTGRDHFQQLDFGARPQGAHDTARYALDPAHANQALGWRARVSLVQGLESMVESLLQSGE